MSIIDDQGRVFGRFNIIDAAVVGAVVIVAPIVYAAYVLFRPPAVVITSVEPAQVVEHVRPRVQVHAQHLRPYLRAQVGAEQPHDFLVASPTLGEFVLPDLPPGSYDVGLFAEAERLALLPKAITVVPVTTSSQLTIRLIGAIVGLEQPEAKAVAVGRQYKLSGGDMAEVLSVDAPQPDVRQVLVGTTGRSVSVAVAHKFQVPASIRVPCTLVEQTPKCSVNTVTVAPGVPLSLSDGHSFMIEDVRPDSSGQAIELVVRFQGRPEIVDQLKPGDRDTLPRGGSEAATIVHVGDRQALQGQIATRVAIGGLEQTTTTSDRLAQVDAAIRLTADVAIDGLSYRGDTLKTGASFTFDAPTYLVRGQVLRMTVVPRGRTP